MRPSSFKRAITIAEKERGPEHPDFAAAIYYLAQFYKNTGRWDEAEQHFARAVAINEKVPSPNGAIQKMYLRSFAVLLEQLDRGDEATALRGRADAIRTPLDDTVDSVLAKLSH